MRFLLKLLDALLPQRVTKALVASATLETLSGQVSPTTHRLAGCSITFLLPYRVPLVRALIHEAKYHDDATAISLLGAVLADYLLAYAEDRQFDTETILLVPVPLGSGRLRERGYNQVERIVRTALERLPERYQLATSLIARSRETRQQARLPRKERLVNMDNAFVLLDERPSNAVIMLIDDVATTGSTLAAVQATLETGTPREVVPLALAH